MRAHHVARLGAFAVPIAVSCLTLASSANAADPPVVVAQAPVGPVTPEPTPEPIATEGNVPGAPISPETKSEVPDDREERNAQRNRFAGSIVLFDQSMTTSSFDRNAQLTYSPLYELWISPRVYYSPIEGLKLGVRFDFFKELFTNHEETTDRGETRVGDPWFTASYSRPMGFINRHPATRWSLGILAKAPLSKESRADGQYLSVGPTAAATIGVPLAGLDATWFPDMSFGLSAQYQHAFTRATTPVGHDLAIPGQDVNGNPRLNDQVRSQTLVGDSLILALSGTVNLTPKFSFSTSYLFIERFSHEPTDATFQGKVVERSPNDTRLRQLSWFIATLNYDPIKELEVSLGYYNLNTTVGLDGRYRNPLGSPDARVFLSLTVNLDVLYEDATKKPPTTHQPAPLRSTTARAPLTTTTSTSN